MRISDWSSEVCSSDLTVDYTANVETATWAALQQCEVATSCTMCHTNQTKCDNCNHRHQFSVVEARKPQACATCHHGVTHKPEGTGGGHEGVRAFRPRGSRDHYKKTARIINKKD